MLPVRQQVPWTRQPQHPVGINWSNPLARGLVSLISAPHHGRIDQVRRSSVTVSGSAKQSIVAGLTAWEMGASGSPLLDCGTNPLPVTGDITVLAIANRRSSSLNASHLVNWNGAATRTVSFLFADGAGSNFGVGVGSPGGTLNGVRTGNIVTATDWYVLIATISGTTVQKFFANGVQYSTAGGGFGSTAGDNLLIGRRVGGTGYFEGAVACAAGWSRILTDGELAALSANPWQLFA